MQAEKIEHERQMNEMNALSRNPDILMPTHVKAASELIATQDRAVQGPSWYLSMDGASEEHAGRVDVGHCYMKKRVHAGWDKGTDTQLLEMVKGSSRKKASQKIWLEEAKRNRLPVTPSYARNALKATVALSQFGPTYGYHDKDDKTCPSSISWASGYQPDGRVALLVCALALITAGSVVAAWHRRRQDQGDDEGLSDGRLKLHGRGRLLALTDIDRGTEAQYARNLYTQVERGSVPGARLTVDRGTQVRRNSDGRLEEWTDGIHLAFDIYHIFEVVPHADGRIFLPILWHGPFPWTTQGHWKITGRRFCSIVTRCLADIPVLGCGCCRATCTEKVMAETGCKVCRDWLSVRAVSRRFRLVVRRFMDAQNTGELSCACKKTIYDGLSSYVSNAKYKLTEYCPRKSIKC